MDLISQFKKQPLWHRFGYLILLLVAIALVPVIYFINQGSGGQMPIVSGNGDKSAIVINVPKGFSIDHGSQYISNTSSSLKYGTSNDGYMAVSIFPIYVINSPDRTDPISVLNIADILNKDLAKDASSSLYQSVVAPIASMASLRLRDFTVNVLNPTAYKSKNINSNAWKFAITTTSSNTDAYSGSAVMALSAQKDKLYCIVILAKTDLWITKKTEWEKSFTSLKVDE